MSFKVWQGPHISGAEILQITKTEVNTIPELLRPLFLIVITTLLPL